MKNSVYKRRAVMPPEVDRRVQLACGTAIYNRRNVIERMFCRVKD